MYQTLNTNNPDSRPASSAASANYASTESETDGTQTPGGVSQIENTTPISAWDLLAIKPVRDALVASWLFAFISIGLEAVWLLWLYTPIQSGGIGLTVRRVLRFPEIL